MEHLQGTRRYARYVAAVCPFHDDNKASLLVFADGFRCLACGERGSLEYLWQRASLRPLSPVRNKPQYYPTIPAGWDNERLVRSAHKMLMDKPGLQQYLIGRGLERAIRRYDLGYWDGWYTIPVKDEDGDINEIVFRAGPWVQSVTGSRFWQRSGQRPRIYIPEYQQPSIHPSLQPGYLFVTFGLFDAMSVSLLGWPAATSTIGKGSFRPEWLAWYDGYVVIIPDLEEEKEAHILASQLGWRGRVCLLPYPEGCKDPNDLLQKHPDLLRERIDAVIRSLSVGKWASCQRAVQPGRRGSTSVRTSV
jgi:hypothetical protein